MGSTPFTFEKKRKGNRQREPININIYNFLKKSTIYNKLVDKLIFSIISDAKSE
jgi:hypothetical protein